MHRFILFGFYSPRNTCGNEKCEEDKRYFLSRISDEVKRNQALQKTNHRLTGEEVDLRAQVWYQLLPNTAEKATRFPVLIDRSSKH